VVRTLPIADTAWVRTWATMEPRMGNKHEEKERRDIARIGDWLKRIDRRQEEKIVR